MHPLFSFSFSQEPIRLSYHSYVRENLRTAYESIAGIFEPRRVN